MLPPSVNVVNPKLLIAWAKVTVNDVPTEAPLHEPLSPPVLLKFRACIASPPNKLLKVLLAQMPLLNVTPAYWFDMTVPLAKLLKLITVLPAAGPPVETGCAPATVANDDAMATARINRLRMLVCLQVA